MNTAANTEIIIILIVIIILFIIIAIISHCETKCNNNSFTDYVSNASQHIRIIPPPKINGHNIEDAIPKKYIKFG